MCPEAKTLCVRRLLVQAHPGEGGSREDDARYSGVVRGVLIALKEVAGHDVALHSRYWRQREPTAGDRVSCCIDSRIGHALQVRIDRDTSLLACDPRYVQVEVVYLRHASGGVYHKLSFDCVFLHPCLCVD